MQVWSLSNYMANVWTYMRHPGDPASPYTSPRQALSPPRLASPRRRPPSRDGKQDAVPAAQNDRMTSCFEQPRGQQTL